MKTALLVVGLSLMANALASTSETKIIAFDGSSSEVSLTFNTKKTRTEYREETRSTGCTTEYVPYDNCNGSGECSTSFRTEQSCSSETVRVPYEVFDANVDASVTVKFGEVPAGLVPNEKVSVTMTGNQLSLSSKGTKTLILDLANLVKEEKRTGSKIKFTAVASINLYEAAPYKGIFDLKAVTIQKSVVNYQLGNVEGLNIKHKLTVYEDDFWTADDLLFRGEVKPAVVSLDGATTSLQVAIKDYYGRTLKKGKYKVTIQASFNTKNEVINATELGGLTDSVTIKYKIK